MKKKLLIGGAVVVGLFIVLGVIGTIIGPKPSGGAKASGSPTSAWSGGTATEQQLCTDLSAHAATSTITGDANAVNTDASTGKGNLPFEVLAYLNAVGGYGVGGTISQEKGRMLGDCRSGQQW